MSDTYGQASVRVIGSSASDTVVMKGAAIRYAFSIPLKATHASLAERFSTFLLSEEGRRALEGQFLVTLPAADAVGTGVPEAVRASLNR
jgi:hypothetical protein